MVADAIYINTDGANTCTRCVPNFRECALILSKPSYLQTDKLHFFTVWITNVAKIDFALSHMFRRRICRTRLVSLPAALAVRCSARRTRRQANSESGSLSADAAHTAKVLWARARVLFFIRFSFIVLWSHCSSFLHTSVHALSRLYVAVIGI